MLAGRRAQIHEERDRKLEQARREREQLVRKTRSIALKECIA
jgi:hypothetical protein